MKPTSLLLGDCLESMRSLPDNSIDSIVCDPPYGISFMSKAWDYQVPSVEIWKEALRILKPGGHLLAFGGTRTYHRLVVAIEDAGFEIRDQIQWLQGQGFPKSQNIALAIDKQLGVKSFEIGENPNIRGRQSKVVGESDYGGFSQPEAATLKIPGSPQGQQWDGWGTALKPANEPICLARKPLSEKTIARNVLKWGTGGINVDATRIAYQGDYRSPAKKDGIVNSGGMFGAGLVSFDNDAAEAKGRFPSNVILDESAADVLDGQAPNCGAQAPVRKKATPNTTNLENFKPHTSVGDDGASFRGDKGGASRFFYVAKASKSDRGEGNVHPTVKPVKLMEYLIKLVTPEGGTVLDPFMGSGTTGVAAKNLGFNFIGYELSPEYFEIAKARIEKT